MNMRDIMTLVEQAGLRFPAPKVVFPDDEVSRTLKQGFDIGRSFNDGVAQYDLDGVHDLFDEATDEGQFDEETDDPAAFLAKWLRGPRYRFIADAIRASAEVRDGGLVIERAIMVQDDVVHAIINGTCPRLGEFWSFRGGEAHWGHTAQSGSKTVTLLAVVDPALVDWVTTFRRNANYSLGDDESEIALQPGTPLKLIGLAVDSQQIERFATTQKA